MPEVVPLKEYLDRRIDDLATRVFERFTLNDDAIGEARRGVNDRLNAMNEFRDALRDQASRMATRIELSRLDEEVQAVRRNESNRDGRQAVLSLLVSGAVSLGLWGLSHWVGK